MSGAIYPGYFWSNCNWHFMYFVREVHKSLTQKDMRSTAKLVTLGCCEVYSHDHRLAGMVKRDFFPPQLLPWIEELTQAEETEETCTGHCPQGMVIFRLGAGPVATKALQDLWSYWEGSLVLGALPLAA